MDNFFIDSVYLEDDNLWDLILGDVAGEKNVIVLNTSAFRPYMKDTGKRMMSPQISPSTMNVKRRMVNLLRKNWEEQKNAVAPEKERSKRHMMKERARREKQKHSYLALHSLLPFPTKNEKKSIVEKAVEHFGKLHRIKKELERKNQVMESKSTKDHDKMNETKVKFNLQEPLSGIDSMLEALHYLKSMGTKLKTVNANFSSHEFSATMNIETQISGEEVERRLQETEWKLLLLPEAS